MAMQTKTRLLSQGYEIDTSSTTFGELRDSSDSVDDVEALHDRMSEDGYLFLPGYLNRDDVMAARRNLLERIDGAGGLRDDADLMNGVLRNRTPIRFEQAITQRTEPLRTLLKDGPMIAFFTRFHGGEVRPFDFIWLRSVVPGKGTAPHGDSVFMNRGTSQLFTAWTPLGDIDTHLGGLIVLENSHRLDEIRNTYGRRDVDTYCDDDPNAGEIQRTGTWPWNGQISGNPVELRERLGSRWLTAEFRMGDLLVFTMHTLHASLDNGSADRIRLSSDTRYQLASEPIDERWIGDDPIGHGAKAMKSIIC